MQQYGLRTFCKNCSFLIYKERVSHITKCPGCNFNELWENIGSPCLTCQLAAIVYRNFFQSRFQSQLQQWLAQNESESSEEEEYTLFRTKTNQAIQNEQSMLQQRNSTIEQNFGEIKYKATPKQTWNIFENLSSIQKKHPKKQ